MESIPRDEIKRKAFHLASLLYIFGYWYLPKTIVICGLLVAIILVAIFEFLRFRFLRLNNFFKSHFQGFYRPSEADKVSGLIWTLSGALITILIFPNKYMVLASFLYFTFGDSVAALTGKTFGKHKFPTGKSLEGSLACFFVCFLSGLFLFNWQFALIGAIIATLIEAIPWKLNDNFWMQIINAGLLTILSNFIGWAK